MLVSAVIPTFNHARYVCEAVESALAQRDVAMEVIVVDDGSTDDTALRLSAYQNRIQSIRQENQGLSAARNAGIQASRGDWIAFLDADDLWHPLKTFVQIHAAVRARSGVCVIGSLSARELPAVLDPQPAVEPLDVRTLLLKTRFGPSGAIVKRECLEKIGGFDVQLGPASDRDLWLRLAAEFPTVRVLSPCWWYREHAGQMSKNASKMEADYDKVLEKFFRNHPEYSEFRDMAWSYSLMDSAICHRECGKTQKALVLAARSMWRYPKSLSRGPLFRLKFLARTLVPKNVLGNLSGRR